MKTREQIYGQEAAGILRDVSMYHALTETQLLKLYPHKKSKIRNLLSYLQKQGRIVQRGEYYRIPSDAEESIDHGLSKAVWVLTDFMEQVEYHSVSDYPAKIIFFADGEVYEIIYAEPGKEQLINQMLSAVKEVPPKYIVLIEQPELIAEIPAGVEQLLGWLASHDVLTPKRMAEIKASLAGLNWQAWLESIAPTVMTGFLGAIGSVVSGTTTVFIALIFAIFTLLGKRRLFAQCARLLERYLSERRRGQVRYVSGILNECFHRFIVGQCTEAVLLGALCALGMLLFGMPHALMIGALTAFTALVPIVGAFIGGAIGAFLLLMESPAQALLFLVFIVVLQQLEGNLIYPHVVGSSLQLPSMWVLAAVTVGGGVLGILGTFLGVPLAASGYRLLKNDVNKRSPWHSPPSVGALSEQEEKQ